MISRTLTVKTVHGYTSPTDEKGTPRTVPRYVSAAKPIVEFPIDCDVTAILVDDANTERVDIRTTDWAEAADFAEGKRFTITLTPA